MQDTDNAEHMCFANIDSSASLCISSLILQVIRGPHICDYYFIEGKQQEYIIY